eukprot:15480425-Alexandrium_andersonii.AAC.1
MLVELVGPILEPRLSVHQTAVAGGDCGSNLRAAFAHLRGAGPLPEGGLPRDPPPSGSPSWAPLGRACCGSPLSRRGTPRTPAGRSSSPI